jgi:hypothetical protein
MVRTRLISVPLVLGLAVALSGCSLLPRVTSSSDATPTPTVLSVADAGAAYAGTICTFNEGARAFADTWTDDAATLRQLKEAASLGQREAEAAKEQLEAAGWPADLAPDIEVIVGYLDERIARFDQVLAAETLEELDPIELATTPDGVNESATRIEEALELGTGYCPGTDAPVEDPAAELVQSTWSGVDSDGDDTVVLLGTEGDAQVTVGTTLYEGTWELENSMLILEVATADNALSFNGVWAPGANSISMSGTATNGHTWTVDLRRI